MNWFKQHIPSFACDSRDDSIPKQSFETTQELLALENVRRWSMQPKFSHFALSDNCLMGVFYNGYCWWVIGLIADPISINLPRWDGGKYHVEMPDGSKIELNGNEVSSSCGDELTLKDGRKAKNLKTHVL